MLKVGYKEKTGIEVSYDNFGLTLTADLSTIRGAGVPTPIKVLSAPLFFRAQNVSTYFLGIREKIKI